MPNLSSFKDIPLWQRSMQLAVEVCKASLQLPHSNKLILGDQLQEVALSIPATIARGSQGGKQSFIRSLMSARQAAAELETLIILMQNLSKDPVLTGLQDGAIELQQAIETTLSRLSSVQGGRNI
jgi:four helix bundle protein